MGKDRTVELQRLAIEGETNKTLDVELFYALGGQNFFSGNNEQRGYYLSATPVSRSEDGMWKTVAAYSGTKMLIEPAARFSQKTLETLAADVLQRPELNSIIESVCQKNGLTLEG